MKKGDALEPQAFERWQEQGRSGGFGWRHRILGGCVGFPTPWSEVGCWPQGGEGGDPAAPHLDSL